MAKRIVFGPLSLLLVFLLGACGETTPMITSCDAKGDLKPLCGFQNPEDLEPLGDGRSLIVSQMRQAGAKLPGSLGFYDTQAKHLKVFPAFTDRAPELWGQPGCEAPGEGFMPHGIHLSRVDEARQRLLVVNHGGREAIESFLIDQRDGEYHIAWQGCVELPEDSFVNDVVAAPDGGFFTTHMFSSGGLKLGPISVPVLQGVLGFKTGWVWRWQPGDEGSKAGEFSKVANFESAYTNGIQLDPSGKYLYVSGWGDNQVHKVDWQAGKLLASVDVSHPDNLQWTESGQLLVASQDFNMGQVMACMEALEGACPEAFKIIELNPDDLSPTVLLSVAGAPMGAGTVAQVLGDHMYIGTFAGDRLLRAPWPSARK